MIKKSLLIFVAFAAVIVSCNKTEDPTQAGVSSDEIVFNVDEESLRSYEETKASVVTSLSNFKAAATRGTSGSETSVWNNVTFTGPTDYKGDKWWPATNPGYHFYASNFNLTFNAGGTTIAATNDIDAVCAYIETSSYTPTTGVKNLLSFQHVFARLGVVEVKAEDGYTISNVHIKITPKISGTYNLRTGFGHNDATGWSGTTEGTETEVFDPSQTIAAGATKTKSNDIYLVPGTYTLTATWTATKGEFTKTYTASDPNVFLEKGKVTKLTAKVHRNGIDVPGMVGDATEIIFSVSVEAWGNTNKDMVFPI